VPSAARDLEQQGRKSAFDTYVDAACQGAPSQPRLARHAVGALDCMLLQSYASRVKALTIRHVDPALARALERERKRRGTSLNETVLDVLRRSLGVVPGERRSNGLRDLAGTWSAREQQEFERATAVFDQIDPELWR
jgi:hypothetical protein